MPTYGEYTTVNAVRAQYLASTQTTDDAQVLDFIRAASKAMDNACNRHFYPLIETRYFDVPGGGGLPVDMFDNMKGGGFRLPLTFDEDLLEVTTLTNGDGTTIASNQYLLDPYNHTPYYQLKIKRSSSVAWMVNTDGDFERVVSVLGVWGFHEDYGNAWVSTTTLSAAIVSTSATTTTVPTGTIYAGQLLKIDSEYIYCSAVSTGATDTLTIVRGVNGSTAATHLISAPVYVWNVGEHIANICKRAAAGLYKIKSNPVGDEVVIDGQSFLTPRDIDAFIWKQVRAIGLVRFTMAGEDA